MPAAFNIIEAFHQALFFLNIHNHSLHSGLHSSRIDDQEAALAPAYSKSYGLFFLILRNPYPRVFL